MKFVWDMKEEEWNRFCNAVERGGYDDRYHGECIGFCRVGDICFDIMPWGEDIIRLGFECFCGGIDNDYGYSAQDALSSGKYNDKYEVPAELLYPYDEVGYDDFLGNYYMCNFEEFKKAAEKEFEDYIKANPSQYKEADLVAKANETLHVW